MSIENLANDTVTNALRIQWEGRRLIRISDLIRHFYPDLSLSERGYVNQKFRLVNPDKAVFVNRNQARHWGYYLHEKYRNEFVDFVRDMIKAGYPNPTHKAIDEVSSSSSASDTSEQKQSEKTEQRTERATSVNNVATSGAHKKTNASLEAEIAQLRQEVEILTRAMTVVTGLVKPKRLKRMKKALGKAYEEYQRKA